MRHTPRLGASRGHVSLPVAVLIFSFLFGRTAHGQAPSVSSAQSERSATPLVLPAAWNDGVKALADKIATAVKPSRTVSLEVKNISSLGAVDVEAIRAALEKELADRGLKIESSGAAIEVTFSEDLENYIWVAEIGNDSTRLAGLIQVARNKDLSSRLVPTPVLQRRIIWRDYNLLLDFETQEWLFVAIEISHLTLWSESGIRFYSLGSDREIREDKEELIPKFPLPRDARGLLAVRKAENLRAYFGHVACIESTPVYCAENSGQDWPIGYGTEGRFVGNRNYFDRINLAPGKQLQQYYSVSVDRWITDGGELWIQAELDGKARLYNNDNDRFEPKATFSGWGDDITSIDIPCGTVWQVLVSGTGDWTEPDHLQVYQITGQNFAKPEGEALLFPGPILAMWPSEDGKSVRVVSKDLKTGMYEASIITVSCSQ
jgi:hypothetical protein